MDKTYHIFISHSWAHSDKYEKLISLLDKEPSFSYSTHFVPKNDPVHKKGTAKELYAAIKEEMNKSSVVLMLAGVYSTYNKWINKEIMISKYEFSTAKPIIAVQPWGANFTSSAVKNAADKLVNWNPAAIIDAIKELG